MKRKALKTLQTKEVEDKTRDLLQVANLYERDWTKTIGEKLRTDLNADQTNVNHFGKGIAKEELDFFEENQAYLFAESSTMWK